MGPRRLRHDVAACPAADGGRRAQALVYSSTVELTGLSVLVPCLNEAGNLRELVGRVRGALALPGAGPTDGPRELVLVDDGSSDGTWEVMEELRGGWEGLRTARHPRRRGIAQAWRTALDQARGGWVCTLDADLQYEPEELARLWSVQRTSGADVVQGARAGDERPVDARWAASRGLNWLLNGVFRMSLRDNKSGFFLCRRQVLEALLGTREGFRHWQCFVMVAAHHHGYQITDVETPFRPRRAGRSAFGRVPVGPTLGVLLDLTTAVRAYPRRRA
jgi:phenylacetate-CoA ligase